MGLFPNLLLKKILFSVEAGGFLPFVAMYPLLNVHFMGIFPSDGEEGFSPLLLSIAFLILDLREYFPLVVVGGFFVLCFCLGHTRIASILRI